jgi:hypothetical protein
MVSANQQQQNGPAHCGWSGDENKPTISGFVQPSAEIAPETPGY